MCTSRRQRARWTTSGEALCRSEQAGRYARVALVSSGHAAGPASCPYTVSDAIIMLHGAAGQCVCAAATPTGLAAKPEVACKGQACCVILPSLCCREKVPAAGQALQEQMHKGITELKRLASEPLGPEVTKKTEAAISYVDTTYQKLISTPAGGLRRQQARLLSWMDSGKSPAVSLPHCGHLQQVCCLPSPQSASSTLVALQL